MQQLIKRFAWVGLLVLSLQGAWAFSLGGPIGNNPNPVTAAILKGDAWQQAVIGYNLPGDINAPKNLGEEYRRSLPVMYYSCDANFLGFFGSNGLVAVDATFDILNSLTNVDSYSSDLSEFSLETRHLNYQAQAMGLVDLKSWMLGAMVEQLGLTDPVRWDWTLHDRAHVTPGPPCPLNMEYLVVQRNFDVITSPLNQLQYSPYINDTLYSYSIQEFCTGPNPLATTFLPPFTPFPVDPLADLYSPVASFISFGLSYGQFYTGLTRDDVAGLRYLLSANNFNVESAPAGSLLVVTNLSSPQLITTTNLGLFLQQAQTLDPNTLLAAYPGLIITATVTNYFTSAFTTNITAFYTNQPGPANTNFATLQLWTNFDLTLFSSLIQTDAPAVIQALYPNLLILSSQIVGFTNIPTPILVTYLTNLIGAPAGSPPLVVTYTNGFTYNIIPLYSYTFGNILTNVYSPNTRATNQTISVTNWIGAPAGSPLITNVAFQRVTLTNVVSGDFFIVPTNWCGFTVQATQLVQVLPSFTNTLVAVSVTNSLGSAQFTQNTVFYYTNRIYAVYPGVCEPVLAFATNIIIGSIVTNYVETFANVVTNSYFPTSTFTFLTTNIFLPPLTPTNTLLVTNITTVTVVSNIPSGDFWIVPAAWNCGYTILSVPSTNTVGSTNTTLVATIPPGIANIGEQYSVTTIFSYTNHSLLIQPILCQMVAAGAGLREGIEKIHFVRANFDSLLGQFFQPITNTFTAVLITNSQAVNQTFQRVVTAPDFIFSAGDLATGPQDTVHPAVASFDRGINFDQTTALPGLAGPGLINPSTTIILNKVGPVYFNYTTIGILLDGTPYFNESPGTDISDSFYAFYFIWSSFDGSTNDPVVYPDGMSIQNLENEVLVQISPTSLPDGTNGVAYPPITFTASGGAFAYSPPPTWTATGLPSAPASGLPPGLSLSSGGTLSGTPTQSGTFDFILKMTDSLSRSVQWNYSVIIQ